MEGSAKSMRKRLLTFLLAGAVVLSLAACVQQDVEQLQSADTHHDQALMSILAPDYEYEADAL